MSESDLAAENARLRDRIEELEQKLDEAEGTLSAIRTGNVDAVVIERDDDPDVYSIAAADRYYFQLAQQAADLGAWDWDLTANRLYWSDGTLRMLGLDAATTEPSLALFWKLLHPHDRDRIREGVDGALNSSATEYYAEFQVCRDDGTCRWLVAKGRVLRNRDGTPRRFFGVNIDITDRKQMEEALVESEAHFRQLADAMPQMVWTARADGHTDYYNERWYEFTGYRRDHFGDDSFTPLLHPEDVERCLAAWYRCVATGEPYVIEYRFWCRKTNAYRWFLTRALPIRDREGRIASWFGTCTDVHDLKEFQQALARSEEALREADRRKDEFLAMLAHELRNPMAPIQTGFDLLSLQLREPNPTIDAMREQFQHLVRLVDDLLDVSRIMRGRIELRRGPTDLTALASRAEATVRPIMQARRQRLEAVLPDRPVTSDVDAVRLLQVLTNLLNNASKYSEPATGIRLALTVEDDMAVFSVRDEGIGIEPEFLPRVFDLFSQASRTLDRAQGGLGIGLTLVKNLVQLHGGTVEARSDGIDAGSEFIVRLPVASAAEAPGAADEPRGPAPARRVLVVDDNRMNTMLTARLLKAVGKHHVETAEDGEAALRIVTEFRPEIVMLDIGLPGMDGYELCQALRNCEAGRRVLMVAVTGYGQPSDRARSREVGFDVHLVKPMTLAMLESVLSHPKLR